MQNLDMQHIVLLDGAMGTILQQSGLQPGQKPELLNIENPAMIRPVYEAYSKAGAQVIYVNTFGANRLKLAGTGYTPAEIIEAAFVQARQAVGNGVLLALDIGPLGELMEPMGSLSFEEAYACFAEMIEAGVKAGADLVVFETMSDLLEVKAGVLAAKEHSSLPIFVTMSFEANGRTFTGCTVESMGMTLSALGVDALGLNCSTGPDQMAPLIEQLAKVTSLPIIAKPNAGLPDPMSGTYQMDPSTFVACMKACQQAGASILGGCCGTTPAYIAALKEASFEELPSRNACRLPSMVCTPTRPILIEGVIPIGERINPTGKKRLQQALLHKDLDYVCRLALEQQEAGALILDVNTGYPGVDEEEMLPAAVKAIQAVCDLPLQLDTSNPKALEKALRIYNGKPSVNSVNASPASLQTILPLVKKYGASVVGLTLDEEGIPSTGKERVALAQRIVQTANALEIPSENIWIDPLALTISAQQEQAAQTLQAIEEISRQMQLPTVLGISNISFGLPCRREITRTFLAMALQAGLQLPILNVNEPALMDTLASFQALSGQDPNSMAYIERFKERKESSQSAVPAEICQSLQTIQALSQKALQLAGESIPSPFSAQSLPADHQQPDTSAASPLQKAILHGLGAKAARLASQQLEAGTLELDLVEQELIPALDQAGKAYEAGTFYLPQLLQAAQAAQQVFEVLAKRMAMEEKPDLRKDTIVLATVQGDIHDIGKNIVKTVLENYGFAVLDLGKDVPAKTIVQAVQQEQIQLVGLSALMTTTLPAMEATVKALKALDHPPKIMVGGAVVTEDYARKIGADFYGKDASASASYARKVFER